MAKYLFLFLMMLPSLIDAHQADISSTMLVEHEDGSWLIQVRAALTAFEYEVHTHYGKDSYSTPEEFRKKVIAHLEKNISISINGQNPTSLQNGLIKLGHESNAIFNVVGIPKKWDSITIKNSSFKDINRNQSALIILKKGYNKNQFILNNQNNHQLKLIVKNPNFVLAPGSISKSKNRGIYYSIGGILLLTGLVIFIKIKFNHQSE